MVQRLVAGCLLHYLAFCRTTDLKKAAPVDHSTDLRLSLTIVILINQDIISIHSEAGYAGERHFAVVPNVPERLDGPFGHVVKHHLT